MCGIIPKGIIYLQHTYPSSACGVCTYSQFWFLKTAFTTIPKGKGISIWYPPGFVWYKVLDDDNTTGIFPGDDKEHCNGIYKIITTENNFRMSKQCSADALGL